MTPEQSQLWQKVLKFELDEPTASLKFSDRLVQETGWTTEYAHRAILEYKKFIYLCSIDDDGVSPSNPVDLVWHLHLPILILIGLICVNTLCIKKFIITQQKVVKRKMISTAIFTKKHFSSTFSNLTNSLRETFGD